MLVRRFGMKNGPKNSPTRLLPQRLILCSTALWLGLCGTSLVFAQDTPAPAPAAPRAGGGGGGRGALRPPNVPNMPGTDSGPGPACSALTAYGELQPPGPPSAPYGPGAPVQELPPAPMYGRPMPPGPNSQLGAAGIASRGTVIPDAPQLPVQYLDAPNPPSGTAGFANVNGVGLLKNGHLIVS